ncbi:MAG: hypothetical protein ABFC31_09825 [Clostridiaceae bacterium]
MKHGFPKFLKYVIVYALLVMLGIGMLFLSGLAPQDQVEKNYLLSMDELEPEYAGHHILRYDWGAYALDDWTEVIILSLSTYMDVKDNPSSVMTNAYPLEDDFTLESARASVENHEPADVFYVRYWHGFRIYVRALLSVMDYGTMRTMMMWTFFLLMAAVTVMLTLQTRSIWPPMFFTAAILFVNPVVASALFQYSSCFVIAFIGMLLVPSWLKKPERAMMGFMILGMATMFFDFYTAPLLTLGLPLLGWLICLVYSKDPPPAKKMLTLSLKALGVWFSSYLSMWLVKLVLTSIFTDQDAFGTAWEATAVRLGIEKSPEYLYRYDKVEALISPFKHLFDWPMLVIFAVILLVAGVVLLLLRTNKKSYARGLVMLFVALLPIFWTLVATQPMIMHAHFQYRILAVTMLGGMYFWLMSVNRSRLPDIKPVCLPEPVPSGAAALKADDSAD